MVAQEPESGFREVVHQRVRLGILAVLDRQGACTFPQLRDALGQSDGALSRHLGVLEDHGYVRTEKVFENKRPRTWVRLTAAGDEAFREEQELLAKLLARAGQAPGDPAAAGRERDERTVDMTIVFAALLAGEDDTDTAVPGGGDWSAAGRMDLSVLVPEVPVLAGWRARPVASGAVSARYDFPTDYADFGAEQREQRLMMISHGLRGGWIATWDLGRETETDEAEPGDPEQGGANERGGVTAHALVLELGAATDCEAILATMSPGTVELPAVPQARAYLLPGGDHGSPATAVAWLSAGPFLACVVVLPTTPDAGTGTGDPAPALEPLVTEVHQTLADHRP